MSAPKSAQPPPLADLANWQIGGHAAGVCLAASNAAACQQVNLPSNAPIVESMKQPIEAVCEAFNLPSKQSIESIDQATN